MTLGGDRDSMSFAYCTLTEDELLALESTLSCDRLAGYKRATGQDRGKAIELYHWNMAMGQALYGPLQTLEVAMRNSMNRELSDRYGVRWYENNPAFMGEAQVEKIQKVKNRFDKNRPLLLSDLVADLSFGFWCALIEHQMYEEVWRQALHKAFPHRPKGTKRSGASIPIIRLSSLRNRIAHHEPIWNRDLNKDHDLIIYLISWICPVTSSWASSHSQFGSIVLSKPSFR